MRSLRNLYQHLALHAPTGTRPGCAVGHRTRALPFHHTFHPGAVGSCRGYAQLALTNKGMAVMGSTGRSAVGALHFPTNSALNASPQVSNMTVTVFGCSSFLGRYVINSLSKTGAQIVCPFRCDELDVQHLKVNGELGRVVLYPDFDVRNDEMLDHAISKSNVVVNLIGSWRETWNYSFKDVHVDLTRRVAEAVKRAGHVERFVHFSCIGARPDAPGERMITKVCMAGDPQRYLTITPTMHNAQAAGEALVRELVPHATIFKVAQVVGIEDKFTTALAARGKRSPFIGLVNGGHNKIQPVYVRDVSHGVVESLKTYDALGQTYYIAGPDVMTYVWFCVCMPRQIIKLFTSSLLS